MFPVVLTSRVRTGPRDLGPGVRRRAVLLSAVLAGTAGATGCGLIDEKPAPPPPPDPLAALIGEALALSVTYRSAAAVSAPDLAARLTAIAADHDAHAREVAQLIATPLPSAPASGPPPSASATPAVTGLRAAETKAHDTAVAACLAASPGRVALLGSIAACRASHLEALA
jgi:hypothetical protein